MDNTDPYKLLFEPIKIGKFTAKNRFYQVPHCNGGGYRDVSAAATMRGIKAEGGWGVVFTEQCEIHETSEVAPYIELHLWEDKDIAGIRRMSERIKAHGALAGIQLAYSGINGPNLYSREVPLAPSAMPIRTFTNDPVSARSMDKQDIKNCRRWFVNAAKRAQQAGFDIVCLYGAHGLGIFQHFFSRLTNHRSDEYGGDLSNRCRFMREVVQDIRDALGDNVALTLRLSLDEEEGGELGFSNAELRDLIAMHNDLPDAWDLAHGSWEDCSATSRFKEEAAQQTLVQGIKELTDKPIIGVGRFTSPDTMVRQIKSGILDFIGCARPSIADPFLPKKIYEGRIDDIRECIGCNICTAGDMTMSLSRCTQNPTFMEEWRKDWHPEKMNPKNNPKGSSDNVLVVGGGPAGLEASLSLARRGYQVVLAEGEGELGGRVRLESRLPRLSAWHRVVDYRLYQLQKLPNVEIYKQSALSGAEILEFGHRHVALATGAAWRRDTVSRQHVVALTDNGMPIWTPDDIMAGNYPEGKIVLFDDDHFYMGGVIAEALAAKNLSVTLITSSAYVSEWTLNTLEQAKIHQDLVNLGVEIILNHGLSHIEKGKLQAACVFSGTPREIACDNLVMVSSRTPNDVLWRDLQSKKDQWRDAGIESVSLIGDAEAPAPIAWAVYAGHRYARELDEPKILDQLSFRREITGLTDEWNA